MASPLIPWMGGKRRLADTLIPRFPAHKCYVEVFAGGAALYFLRPPAEVEVINDCNGELVNLYRVVKNHLEEFVRQFKWALSSRDLFRWLQDTPPETLTDVQRAARFYYLQHQCFGGKIESQTWGTATTAPRRYDRPHTFFYMDPPYWQTAGYGVPFGFEQYELMAEVMRGLKGKAMLSINDHPDIREAFAGFHMETVDIDYTVGGGDKAAARRELVIWSWDVAADPAGLF